jgi:hypothetical protein
MHPRELIHTPFPKGHNMYVEFTADLGGGVIEFSEIGKKN